MTEDIGASVPDRATQQSPSRSVSALSGEYPSRDVMLARCTSVSWAERMAVSDLDIEAALHAYVPGGSSVMAWLPMKDGWTPHDTAYDVLRAAIATVDKYRSNLRDSDGSGEADKTGTGLAEGDSAGPKDIAKTTTSENPS